MKIEEKINMIGRILADIQLEIKTIKRSQKELRDFLTNPDKLNFERFWRKTSDSEPEGSTHNSD
jgi:hypothetical protein